MNNIPAIHFYANTTCGLGHIMRSRALQNAWKSMFGDKITYNSPIDSFGPGIVVFDDYGVTDESRAGLMKNGDMVVSYTEFNVEQVADIIINQNIGAKAYGGRKNLLGPKYFALRDEYVGLKTDTSGGVFDADAEKRSLSPLEFAQKMALAECVISATGLAAYEALYLGKPLLLRCIADNQELSYNGLISEGYALPATDENVADVRNGIPVLRDGRFLVDGLGASRVCREIFMMWRQLHG